MMRLNKNRFVVVIMLNVVLIYLSDTIKHKLSLGSSSVDRVRRNMLSRTPIVQSVYPKLTSRQRRQTPSGDGGEHKTNTSVRGFTDDEKISLVHIHNQLRATVQPAASNMRYMVSNI
jgi:hypothetical protein